LSVVKKKPGGRSCSSAILASSALNQNFVLLFKAADDTRVKDCMILIWEFWQKLSVV